MSTEYILHRTCQVTGDQSTLPLGLSVGARRFQFRAHPQLGLTSFDALVEFIKRDGAEVVTEYDEVIPLDQFIEFVQRKLQVPVTSLRRHERDEVLFEAASSPQDWVDAQGHSFSNYDFF